MLVLLQPVKKADFEMIFSLNITDWIFMTDQMFVVVFFLPLHICIGATLARNSSKSFKEANVIS